MKLSANQHLNKQLQAMFKAEELKNKPYTKITSEEEKLARKNQLPVVKRWLPNNSMFQQMYVTASFVLVLLCVHAMINMMQDSISELLSTPPIVIHDVISIMIRDDSSLGKSHKDSKLLMNSIQKKAANRRRRLATNGNDSMFHLVTLAMPRYDLTIDVVTLNKMILIE